MKYVFYVIVSIYALLCVLAPVVKIKQWKTYPSMVSMFIGGITLGTSVVLHSSGFQNAWILALGALSCIAISAWKNGEIQGKRNLPHHIVRGVVSILLLVGFVVL